MKDKFVAAGFMGKRRWLVCPDCSTRNWWDRKFDPQKCSRCGAGLTGRSFWPEDVRRFIIRRDRGCLLRPFAAVFGSCEGELEVIHLKLRQHGGKMRRAENGGAICRKHADFLIYGRRGARSLYGRRKSSFDRWHSELLYVSYARLPREIRDLRTFLLGIVWERTRAAQQRATHLRSRSRGTFRPSSKPVRILQN